MKTSVTETISSFPVEASVTKLVPSIRRRDTAKKRSTMVPHACRAELPVCAFVALVMERTALQQELRPERACSLLIRAPFSSISPQALPSGGLPGGSANPAAGWPELPEDEQPPRCSDCPEPVRSNSEFAVRGSGCA